MYSKWNFLLLAYGRRAMYAIYGRASLFFSFLFCFIRLPHLYIQMEIWFFAFFYFPSNLHVRPSLSRIFIFPHVCLICAVIIQPPQFPTATREQIKIFAREIFTFDCWISSSVFLFRATIWNVMSTIYFWRTMLHVSERVKWMDKILLRTLMRGGKEMRREKRTFHLHTRIK